MRIRSFRVLVLASWLLLLVSYVLPEYLVPNDPGLARLAQYDGYGAILRGNIFFVLPLWLTLFASVGLVFFQNWGRYLYAAGVAYSLATILLCGYRVSSPLDSLMGFVGALLEGTILTLCFLVPFKANFSQPANPNLSLNADVPHAGLRPGMWPPVS